MYYLFINCASNWHKNLKLKCYFFITVSVHDFSYKTIPNNENKSETDDEHNVVSSTKKKRST